MTKKSKGATAKDLDKYPGAPVGDAFYVRVRYDITGDGALKIVPRGDVALAGRAEVLFLTPVGGCVDSFVCDVECLREEIINYAQAMNLEIVGGLE